MPEIYLNPINTIEVAAAVTGAEESYIRQALDGGRLACQADDKGEALISIDDVRELQRSDGLRA